MTTYQQDLNVDLMWFSQAHSVDFNELEIRQFACFILFTKRRHNLPNGGCFTSTRNTRDVHTPGTQQKGALKTHLNTQTIH